MLLVVVINLTFKVTKSRSTNFLLFALKLNWGNTYVLDIYNSAEVIRSVEICLQRHLCKLGNDEIVCRTLSVLAMTT